MEIDAKQKLVPVSVQRLQIGMFVAELDRPWSDTPFHFQGFEILSNSEIELLERHCKTVFIDPKYVSASSTARHKLDASARRKGLSLSDDHVTTQAVNAQRLRLLAGITSAAPYDYPTKTKMKRESKHAIEAFDQARIKCEKLHKAIRRGKPVHAKHCRGVVEDIAKSVMRNPDALAWLTFLRKSEPQPNDRSVSSAVWCAIFARHLGLAPNVLLDMASGALLMDIGMMKVATTLKSMQGTYERRQKLAMQSHVRIGLEVLESIDGVSKHVFEMLSQHHERFDGKGYPLGLSASNISAAGAMAAVIDSYDAMISDTGHRPALSSSDAISELKRLSGSQFSALVVEQFVQALGMFPSGSLVELNTGEVAIVAEQDPNHRLRPHLLIVRDAQKDPMHSPKRLNLAGISRESGNDKAKWVTRGLPTGSYGIDPASYFL